MWLLLPVTADNKVWKVQGFVWLAGHYHGHWALASTWLGQFLFPPPPRRGYWDNRACQWVSHRRIVSLCKTCYLWTCSSILWPQMLKPSCTEFFFGMVAHCMNALMHQMCDASCVCQLSSGKPQGELTQMLGFCRAVVAFAQLPWQKGKKENLEGPFTTSVVTLQLSCVPQFC